MRLPKANCPNCNSIQRFSPKERLVGDTIEIFIYCFACRTETLVEKFPASEQRKRQREATQRNRRLRRVR